jgi:hypothetical protein
MPPMKALDGYLFPAALVWLLTFGICYVADFSGFSLLAIPTIVALVFLIIFREK